MQLINGYRTALGWLVFDATDRLQAIPVSQGVLPLNSHTELAHPAGEFALVVRENSPQGAYLGGIGVKNSDVMLFVADSVKPPGVFVRRSTRIPTQYPPGLTSDYPGPVAWRTFNENDGSHAAAFAQGIIYYGQSMTLSHPAGRFQLEIRQNDHGGYVLTRPDTRVIFTPNDRLSVTASGGVKKH